MAVVSGRVNDGQRIAADGWKVLPKFGLIFRSCLPLSINLECYSH